MAVFLKNVTFHGILLDSLFEEGGATWQEVSELLKAGIQEGVVQPLKCTVFPRTKVEAAFRYMAQGKHIGKVVIQVSGAPQRPSAVPAGGGRHLTGVRLRCRCARRSRGRRRAGCRPSH